MFVTVEITMIIYCSQKFEKIVAEIRNNLWLCFNSTTFYIYNCIDPINISTCRM